jgi:hypothetical protein
VIRLAVFLIVFLAVPIALGVWLVTTLGAIRRNGERTVELLQQVVRQREDRF